MNPPWCPINWLSTDELSRDLGCPNGTHRTALLSFLERALHQHAIPCAHGIGQYVVYHSSLRLTPDCIGDGNHQGYETYERRSLYSPCDCSQPILLECLGYFGRDVQSREAHRFSTVQNEMLTRMSFLDLQYVTHHEMGGWLVGFHHSIQFKFTVTGGLTAMSRRGKERKNGTEM